MLRNKKSPRADLNRFSGLFLLLGLVLVLFASWRVVESKRYDNAYADAWKWAVSNDDLEQDHLVKKPEKPKPKKQIIKRLPPDVIHPVDNNKKDSVPQFGGTEILPDDTIPDLPQAIEPDGNGQVTVPFILVESPPVFPGCEKYKGDKDKLKACMSRKIERFIRRHFDRSIGEDIGATGIVKVSAQFVVDENGNVVDIETRSSYKELQNEAVRVLKQLPKMQPGQQRGKPVRVQYNLPIIFRAN